MPYINGRYNGEYVQTISKKKSDNDQSYRLWYCNVSSLFLFTFFMPLSFILVKKLNISQCHRVIEDVFYTLSTPARSKWWRLLFFIYFMVGNNLIEILDNFSLRERWRSGIISVLLCLRSRVRSPLLSQSSCSDWKISHNLG